jgi:hypothetical protein
MVIYDHRSDMTNVSLVAYDRCNHIIQSIVHKNNMKSDVMAVPAIWHRN